MTPTADDLRLHCGEMNADELRACRAGYRLAVARAMNTLRQRRKELHDAGGNVATLIDKCSALRGYEELVAKLIEAKK